MCGVLQQRCPIHGPRRRTSNYVYTQIYILRSRHSLGGKPGDGPRMPPHDPRPKGSEKA